MVDLALEIGKRQSLHLLTWSVTILYGESLSARADRKCAAIACSAPVATPLPASYIAPAAAFALACAAEWHRDDPVEAVLRYHPRESRLRGGYAFRAPDHLTPGQL